MSLWRTNHDLKIYTGPRCSRHDSTTPLPPKQTASENAFQRTDGQLSPKEIAKAAYGEVTAVAARLEEEGVNVHIFEAPGEKETPDSVFPNNWFSTHPGGHVAIYPMYNPSRRRESRYDIVEMLKAEY